MNSEKYIGLDVHQATISVAWITAARWSWNAFWKPKPPRSWTFLRTAWNFIGDLRGGDLGCLVVRSAARTRGPTGGV